GASVAGVLHQCIASSERTRAHFFAGLGMQYLTERTLNQSLILEARSREVGGKVIIIVHCPAVEWMIVASRAGHPRAKQSPAHKFTHVTRIGRGLVKVGRP